MFSLKNNVFLNGIFPLKLIKYKEISPNRKNAKEIFGCVIKNI